MPETQAQTTERVVQDMRAHEMRPFTTSRSAGWYLGPWRIQNVFSPRRPANFMTLWGNDLAPSFWNPSRKAEFQNMYWPDLLPWMQVFCGETSSNTNANTATNCRAELWDICLQVLRQDGTWTMVRRQATIGGAGYRYDFAADAQYPVSIRTENGRVSAKPSANGVYIYHGWGAVFDNLPNPSTVRGFCVTMKGRLIPDNPALPFDHANCRYVLSVGLDARPRGTNVPDYAPAYYVPGIGCGRTVILTPDERLVSFTSLTEAEIRANPPPPIDQAANPTTPTNPASGYRVCAIGTSLTHGSAASGGVNEATYVSHFGPFYKAVVDAGVNMTVITTGRQNPKRDNRAPPSTMAQGGATAAQLLAFLDELKAIIPSGPYTDLVLTVEGLTNDSGSMNAAQMQNWWQNTFMSRLNTLFPGCYVIGSGLMPAPWLTTQFNAVQSTMAAMDTGGKFIDARLRDLTITSGEYTDGTHFTDGLAVKIGQQEAARFLARIGVTTPTTPTNPTNPTTPSTIVIKNEVPWVVAQGLWREEWTGDLKKWKASPPPIIKAAAITTISLPEATVGEPYSFQLAGTGEGVLSYTVIDLPAGFVMSSLGEITSTGNVLDGVYSIRVTIHDNYGVGASRTFNLTVLPADEPETVASIWSTKVVAR